MSILPLIIFVLYYGVGAYGIFFLEKKKKVKNSFFLQGSWLLFSITLYTSVLELMNNSAFFLIPLTFFLIFIFYYLKQRARLLNGFLFLMFLIIYGVYLIYNFYITRDLLIIGLLFIALMIFLLINLFGVISLITFLYWNAFIVLKKEARSLANMLTLFLAILLTLYILASFFITKDSPWYFTIPHGFLSFTLIYFFSLLITFLTATLLYQFYRPSYTQDFVIVLGAGLINGERVTPLLAKRIDRAITFYNTQQVKTGHPLKFIMSGGQGSDEKIPEAIAMRNYAVEKGITDEEILLESNSSTTFENMKFSKEIIESQQPTNYQVIFSSNNYHIFRAAIFAERADLQTDGIGSHTAFYYLPNAFLREFAAILMMHRKRHIIIIAVAFAFSALFGIINLFQ